VRRADRSSIDAAPPPFGREHGKFALWGGFLRVGNDKVTVLGDRADDVDEPAAKRELDEALEALRTPPSATSRASSRCRAVS
jgi:F0F1-type ATP synthase epsilon subunit